MFILQVYSYQLLKVNAAMFFNKKGRISRKKLNYLLNLHTTVEKIYTE